MSKALREHLIRDVLIFMSRLFGVTMIVLGVVISFSPFMPEAQTTDGKQTDAVFLLDITRSTVGAEITSEDILQEIIDRLLWDIEQFEQGRIVLITFANGPYDLDGAGPIQAVVSRTIQTEEDKLYLKRFLRPAEYGAFPDKPSWPGVYEAVKRESPSGTHLYQSVQRAIQILQDRQASSDTESYVDKHFQKIYVYSDGADNQTIGGPSFRRIVDQLRNRHSQMQGRFDFRRYLFLQNNQIPRDECRLIEDMEATEFVHNIVAESVQRLVTIELDRQVFSFPNLWAHAQSGSGRSVTLKNVQLRYLGVDPNELAGKRLEIRPLNAQDFGLPPGVAVQVRTTPRALQLPLEEFDITLTFSPISNVDQELRTDSPVTLKGNLRLQIASTDSAMQGSSGGCILSGEENLVFDLRQTRIPTVIPYELPELEVEAVQAENDRVRVDIVPNQRFSELPQDERLVNLQVLPVENVSSVVDATDQRLDLSRPIQIPTQPFTAFVDVRANLACGETRELEVRVSTPRFDVLINGNAGEYFTEDFTVQRVTLQPGTIRTANLWSPNRWASENRDPATSAVKLTTCSTISGQIQLVPEEVPIPGQVELDPSQLAVGTSTHNHDIELTVTPDRGWQSLGDVIGRPGPDFKLKPIFSSSEDDVLTLGPPLIPVDLVYAAHFVSIEHEQLVQDEAVSAGTDIFRLAVLGHGLDKDSGLAMIEDDSSQGPTWQIVQSGSSEVKTIDEQITVGSGTYFLRIHSNLGESIREGALHYRAADDLPLQFNGTRIASGGDSRSDKGYRFEIVVPTLQFSCTQRRQSGRWYRGQMLFSCQPSSPDLDERRLSQAVMTLHCNSRLSYWLEDQRAPCDEALPVSGFRVRLASSGPASNFTVDADSIGVSAQLDRDSRAIQTEMELEALQGYLYPQTYDQFWEGALSTATWVVWIAGIGLGLILVLISSVTLISAPPFILFKMNPLEVVLIFLQERVGKLAVGAWLAIAFAITVGNLLAGWAMAMQYGV